MSVLGGYVILFVLGIASSSITLVEGKTDFPTQLKSFINTSRNLRTDILNFQQEIRNIFQQMIVNITSNADKILNETLANVTAQVSKRLCAGKNVLECLSAGSTAISEIRKKTVIKARTACTAQRYLKIKKIDKGLADLITNLNEIFDDLLSLSKSTDSFKLNKEKYNQVRKNISKVQVGFDTLQTDLDNSSYKIGMKMRACVQVRLDKLTSGIEDAKSKVKTCLDTHTEDITKALINGSETMPVLHQYCEPPLTTV